MERRSCTGGEHQRGTARVAKHKIVRAGGLFAERAEPVLGLINAHLRRYGPAGGGTATAPPSRRLAGSRAGP